MTTSSYEYEEAAPYTYTHAHGARRQKLVHCNGNGFCPLLLTLMCIITSSTVNGNGSSSPMATAFAPPYFSTTRAIQFDYRNTHQKSTVEESAVSNRIMNDGYNRRNAKSISKIKSPSNSYNQFYKEGVLVGIENTSPQSRRISGEITVDLPMEAIWNILTDYDNLSTHVPNLVESKVINNGGRIVGDTPRVFQRGASKIFGFEFGADVTMDMTEVIHHDGHGQYDEGQNNEPKMYSIDFECVDSQFFSQFDGSWILEEYSNSKTMVRYIVDVRPKGPVPVAALEWRIKEDVPVNILAVSKSASRVTVSAQPRRVSEESIQAPQELELIPETQQTPSRSQQPTPSPSSNPLRRLTDQATNDLKRAAKYVLPTPVYSTARQAIGAINASNPFSRQNAVPSMSMNSGRNDRVGIATNVKAKVASMRKKNRLASKESVVVDYPWYEDETMAMYLKDP